MSATRGEALTLPVSDLHAATSFYLTALQPLDYCHISTGSHQTSWGSSQTVGLGPAGTSRVDLFLSESDQLLRRESLSSSAQVVFPALSRASVREAYAAALNAGGRSVSAPQYDDGTDTPAIFAAVVTDLDRNKLRIEFEDGSVREVVHRQGVTSGTTSQRSYNAERTSHGKPKNETRSALQGSSGKCLSQTVNAHSENRSNDVGETPTSHSSKNTVGKGVVGALIGAAAGAALAYTVVASQQDSKQRERDFSSRMRARDRVKTEAWAHSSGQNAQNWHVVPKRQSSKVRRDSGYWSLNERAQGFSYDGNSHSKPEPRPRTRRSVSVSERDRKYIEWDSSESSGGPRRGPRRSSVDHNDSTTKYQPPSQFRKPAKMSASLAPPSSTSRWKELFQPPVPPTMPNVPWEPAEPSTPSRARRSSSPANLNRSSTFPPSRPEPSARKATEGNRGAESSVGSRKSNGTAIRAPLPPSMAPSSRSTITAKNISAGPVLSNSGGTKLTASSLAAHNVPLPDSIVGDRSIIDDLETVMPDDSISSVGHRSKARSATSRHSNR